MVREEDLDTLYNLTLDIGTITVLQRLNNLIPLLGWRCTNGNYWIGLGNDIRSWQGKTIEQVINYIKEISYSSKCIN
jgi:hypothetical protein